MNSKMAKEPECIWMAEHCQEYGFIIRYPADKEDVTEINYEPWHLRYVGIPAATYIMENGLRGLKMHPDSQQFAIDDPRLFPVYEAIQGKIPVILHMGDVRFDYSHPSRLRHVLEQFPKLQVIAAHFGGYSMPETAYEELKDKNCYFDISSSMMFMEDGAAERYIRAYGAHRFVYGTDFPLWDPRVEVPRFLRLKLTVDELEQIAYKTALHILKED
jgi:predicted TIM-barrel fold metal-dependent hydrolase